MKTICFVDHYDSFSFNVIDWLRADGRTWQVEHVNFDDASAMDRLAADPKPLVLSPGPRDPREALSTIELTKNLLGHVPILGICLGHQILGHIAGFKVERAQAPFHGSAFSVKRTTEDPLFTGMPDEFLAATYNSLVIAGAVPTEWTVSAVNTAGEIQAINWLPAGMQPAFGVQFHPESFLTEQKEVLRANWLAIVDRYLRG